jgi:HAMP domain-containing protein
MVQVLTAAMTATLTGLGWLISRWLQRDALTERVDHRLKLVALHQRMTKAGLTLDDLERLEKELVTCHPNEVSGQKVDGIARRPDVHHN